MRIESLSWRQFAAAAKTTRLALVPVGAVEPNGPHMAQGLDNFVGVALADAIAERTGALVAPSVSVGFSERLDGFPGMLTVPEEVVEAYCDGIARSLIRNGLDRVLFVCGHGGNTPALERVAYRLQRELPGCRLAIAELWKILQPLAEDLAEGTEHRFGHAGEMPTSLLLHLRPDLVDMSATGLERTGLEPDPFGIFRPREYARKMPNGALGDTSLATAEKGAALFERMADALASFATTDPDFAAGPSEEAPR